MCFKLISATTPTPYHNIGGGYTKSKLIDTLKSTIGYDNGNYGREYKEWINDNPFTTNSYSPLTTDTDKPKTQTQAAMLEVFQYLHTTTVKPIVNAISTWLPSSSSSVSFVTNEDEWGKSVDSYRVDEPPHLPGLSLECRTVLTFCTPLHFLFAVSKFFLFILVHLFYLVCLRYWFPCFSVHDNRHFNLYFLSFIHMHHVLF